MSSLWFWRGRSYSILRRVMHSFDFDSIINGLDLMIYIYIYIKRSWMWLSSEADLSIDYSCVGNLPLISSYMTSNGEFPFLSIVSNALLVYVFLIELGAESRSSNILTWFYDFTGIDLCRRTLFIRKTETYAAIYNLFKFEDGYLHTDVSILTSINRPRSLPISSYNYPMILSTYRLRLRISRIFPLIQLNVF